MLETPRIGLSLSNVNTFHQYCQLLTGQETFLCTLVIRAVTNWCTQPVIGTCRVTRGTLHPVDRLHVVTLCPEPVLNHACPSNSLFPSPPHTDSRLILQERTLHLVTTAAAAATMDPRDLSELLGSRDSLNSNPSRDSDSVNSDAPPPRYYELDDAKLREIEEIKARSVQMEKTMKWWSECTANWRDKWSKVRAERNKAREELKGVKGRLDGVLRELEAAKEDRVRLQRENERLTLGPESGRRPPRLSATYGKEGVVDLPEKDVSEEVTGFSSPDNNLRALQVKLEEANKVIVAERNGNNQLYQQIDELRDEVKRVKTLNEQTQVAKDALTRELELARENHRNTVETLNTDIEDANCRKGELEKKISLLREEIEALQVENTAEWGKREFLETEKFQLERETKRLRTQVKDLQELVSESNPKSKAASDANIPELQSKLAEKERQISDLKHSESKLKKQLAEKCSDLEHVNRRCTQSEKEVKQLRHRVEQLKQEVMDALEDSDSHANQVKKLQRELDEKNEDIEELRNEVENLKRKLTLNMRRQESEDELASPV